VLILSLYLGDSLIDETSCIFTGFIEILGFEDEETNPEGSEEEV
jgi:hypothetical protein